MRRDHLPPPTLSVDDFSSYHQAYAKFAEDHPLLGLTGSRHAGDHFRRVNYDTLIAAGAIVRLSNGRLLAHKALFPRVAAELYLSAAFAPRWPVTPAAEEDEPSEA
jgi:hypothetical protein